MQSSLTQNAETSPFTSELQYHDLRHALFFKVFGMSSSSIRQPAVASIQGVAGNCSEHNTAKEKNSFQVDLRVHGVSQDVNYKDKGRITKIQTLEDWLLDGSRSKSIQKDLKTSRSIQCVQRGIKTCNQRHRQHRAVRHNNSVSCVL